mgnify:CR=1 FL=1
MTRSLTGDWTRDLPLSILIADIAIVIIIAVLIIIIIYLFTIIYISCVTKLLQNITTYLYF